VYHHSSIPLRLRELMRSRVALINQCLVCMETRLEGGERIGMSDDDDAELDASIECLVTSRGVTKHSIGSVLSP
jgi:AhpD family alkylhydroperoxidase